MNKNNETGYNLELKEMVQKLKQVDQFFTEYGQKAKRNDIHILNRTKNINDHLCEAANEIAELVGIEFIESLFYE